jgi:predicted O-methyltransferase YrrM
MLRSRIRQSNAHFIRGDYDRLDFASYDVVFAYLSPAAMPALWQKANVEMRKGSLLLSYEFDIPGVEPHFARAPVHGGPLLYGWRI